MARKLIFNTIKSARRAELKNRKGKSARKTAGKVYGSGRSTIHKTIWR